MYAYPMSAKQPPTVPAAPAPSGAERGRAGPVPPGTAEISPPKWNLKRMRAAVETEEELRKLKSKR